MTVPAVASPPCPVCGGAMYDNRGTKKNAKQPDFKCKRYKEGCAGVIWPPKGKVADITPINPLPSNAGTAEPPAEKPKLTQLYLDATTFVLEKIVNLYEAKEIGVSDQAVAAMVATLYISATKER